MYAIMMTGGQYLSRKKVWGPTFTIFRDDAKTFKTEREARAYLLTYLSDLGAFVAYL